MTQLIEINDIVKHVNARVVSAFYDIRSGKVEWL